MPSFFKKTLVLLLIFFLEASLFGAGFLTAQKGLLPTSLSPSTSSNLSSDQLDLTLFWKVLNSLKEKFYDQSKLSTINLLYGAIRGMVSAAGDPYTAFFDPSQNKSFQNELSGVYEGIGAQLGFKTLNGENAEPQLVIISPLNNSPAQRSGVKAGDLILRIDEKTTQGMSLAEAASLLRGQEGTEVKVSLARLPSVGNFTKEDLSKAAVFDLRIKRAKVKVESLSLEWKKDNLALIKISRFGDDTSRLWNTAAQSISDKCLKKKCSLILDLRNNPGGLLEAASNILSDFFQDGTVVIREYPSGLKDRTTINSAGRLLDEEVVVLINAGSASSSEIVAGALRDRGRARLVGEKSFGKGTVQEVVNLDGGSALHITSSKWLLPSGRWINGEGLKPDYPVDFTDEDFKMGKDPQMDKAIELTNQ